MSLFGIKINKTKVRIYSAKEVDDLLKANGSIPVGSGYDYFGTTAPTNYMFADGSEISRTDYAELFSVIGETYGAGDGETTFNLPDKRKKVSVMIGDGDNLGDSVGNNSVILTSDNLPNVDLGTVVTSVKANKANTWDVSKTNSSATDIVQETKRLSIGSENQTPIDNRQLSLICNYIIKVK